MTVDVHDNNDDRAALLVRDRENLRDLLRRLGEHDRGRRRGRIAGDVVDRLERPVVVRVRAAEDQARGEMFAARATETDATLLFSDVSGFTAMSSKMSPAQVIALMNAYFDEMCPVVVENGGDIDKFIGDAIMAVFGAPVPDPEDPLRAVKAAT